MILSQFLKGNNALQKYAHNVLKPYANTFFCTPLQWTIKDIETQLEKDTGLK